MSEQATTEPVEISTSTYFEFEGIPGQSPHWPDSPVGTILRPESIDVQGILTVSTGRASVGQTVTETRFVDTFQIAFTEARALIAAGIWVPAARWPSKPVPSIARAPH